MESNILLAEFMGLKLNGGGMSIFDEPNLSFFRVTEYEKDGLCPYCHNGVSHGRNIKCYVLNPEKLQYDTDWNRLMEVVEKIENLGMLFKVARWREDEVLLKGYWCTISDSFSGVEFADSAYIDDTETRIEAIYLACIQFVKWYNNENKR